MNFTEYSDSETEVTNISIFTLKVSTLVIPLSLKDFTKALNKWRNGTLIQNAFPTLTAEQREFLKTGCHPTEWKTLFGVID